MTAAPTDDELAALVAAYAVLAGSRRVTAAPPIPRWRRAARLESVRAVAIGDRAAVRSPAPR